MQTDDGGGGGCIDCVTQAEREVLRQCLRDKTTHVAEIRAELYHSFQIKDDLAEQVKEAEGDLAQAKVGTTGGAHTHAMVHTNWRPGLPW